MDILKIMSFLQFLITLGTLGTMIYTFKTFLNKPRVDLEERVSKVEYKVKEIEKSLNDGKDHFRENDDAIKQMILCLLGLIDFEIQFCMISGTEVSDELKKIRADLDTYLAKK
jgi:hypothetical protein